jgi:hypothetical protein
VGTGSEPPAENVERATPVEVVNASHVARRVSRSLWWLWAIPLVVALVVGVVALASWYSTRRAHDRDVQAELDARSSAPTQTGDGWEITRNRCTGDNNEGVATGQIKNTDTTARSFEVDVNFVDGSGTVIGADSGRLPSLDPGQTANFGLDSPLVRFADGPALAKCVMSAAKAPDASDFTLPTFGEESNPGTTGPPGSTSTTSAPFVVAPG